MKLRLMGLGLLAAVLPGTTAQISTSILCVLNDAVVSDPAHCVLSDATGTAWADAFAREGMHSPFQYSASVAIDILAGLESDAEGLIQVRALAEIHGLFTTEGPVRHGFIRLGVSFFLEGHGLGVPAIWRVGAYSGDENDRIDAMYPFVLGQPFLMDMWNSHSFDAPNPSGINAEWHTVAGNLTFMLYEADGVTPVALLPLAIPEPGGTAAAGLSTIVLFNFFGSGALRRLTRSDPF